MIKKFLIFINIIIFKAIMSPNWYQSTYNTQNRPEVNVYNENEIVGYYSNVFDVVSTLNSIKKEMIENIVTYLTTDDITYTEEQTNEFIDNHMENIVQCANNMIICFLTEVTDDTIDTDAYDLDHRMPDHVREFLYDDQSWLPKPDE